MTLKRSIEIPDRHTAARHPDTAARFVTLAETCLREGKIDDARGLLERALAVHQRTLGPVAPETLRDLVKLATILEQSGDVDGAIERYERTAALFDRVAAGRASDAATVLMNLGRLYTSRMQQAKALEAFQHALRLVETSRDERVARIYESLARLHWNFGRFREADGFFGLATVAWQDLPGDHIADIRANVEKHAMLLRELGRGDEACHLLQAAEPALPLHVR